MALKRPSTKDAFEFYVCFLHAKQPCCTSVHEECEKKKRKKEEKIRCIEMLDPYRGFNKKDEFFNFSFGALLLFLLVSQVSKF